MGIHGTISQGTAACNGMVNTLRQNGFEDEAEIFAKDPKPRDQFVRTVARTFGVNASTGENLTCKTVQEDTPKKGQVELTEVLCRHYDGMELEEVVPTCNRCKFEMFRYEWQRDDAGTLIGCEKTKYIPPTWLTEAQMEDSTHPNYHQPERRWWKHNLTYRKKHFPSRTQTLVPLLNTTKQTVIDGAKSDWPKTECSEYLEKKYGKIFGKVNKRECGPLKKESVKRCQPKRKR